MLSFNNVSFAYPGTSGTINDLSFTINEGEIVSLIGTNGAGKSTISRLSNGLLLPTAGEVIVGGCNTKTVRTSEIAKFTGFLFQNPDRQICQNTVREEVAFGLKVQGIDEAEIERKVDEALKTFELDGDWFPFTRSRGERQRIALASVLVCEPKFVILDEPTTGLDYRECITIMNYLTKLNKEKGLTIMMVSHDMEIVQEFAQRVLVLTGGHLVGDGPTNEIMKNTDILKLANVCPAQIPTLALRFGDEFKDVYTVDDMVSAIKNRISGGMS